MPYVITEACQNVKDKACVDVCPVDCIYEGPEQLYIHPDECIDCGACEPECPVEAIFPEEALPDKWNAFVEINYAFPDPPKINALVTAALVGNITEDTVSSSRRSAPLRMRWSASSSTPCS